MTPSDAVFNLTIVIPAFNEGANIASTVEEAIHRLGNTLLHCAQFVLVDDGSSDETGREMEALARKFPQVTVISHQVNKGLGAAIYSGMLAATEEWVSWIPADGQISPENIELLSRAVDTDSIAILLRPERQRTLGRRILTAAFSCVVQAALSDRYRRYSGVFLVPRERVKTLQLVASTAVQNLAVIEHCVLQGARVAAVEGTLRPRASGFSKVANAKTTLQTFWETLCIKRRMNDQDA